MTILLAQSNSSVNTSSQATAWMEPSAAVSSSNNWTGSTPSSLYPSSSWLWLRIKAVTWREEIHQNTHTTSVEDHPYLSGDRGQLVHPDGERLPDVPRDVGGGGLGEALLGGGHHAHRVLEAQERKEGVSCVSRCLQAMIDIKCQNFLTSKMTYLMVQRK